jgi:hypothetical protein
MKLGIMQPYFLPYIGYFQLIGAVDVFILYDNIKYTKKGWINRNRMLLNGKDTMFSLPLKKASDTLNIVERELIAEFDPTKLLNQFKGAYSHAPQFELTYPLLEEIVRHEDNNLFGYINYSIVRLCAHLGIKTKIIISSEIDIDHQLKGQDKVLALCCAIGADTYINPIGGTGMYSKKDFSLQGIELQFIKSRDFIYSQFDWQYVPFLSIIDVLMFNSKEIISADYLFSYEKIG